MIEIPFSRATCGGRLIIGAAAVVTALSLVTIPAARASTAKTVLIGILVAGGLCLLSAIRSLVIRAPNLRATSAGVQFYGASLIAWRDIEQVSDWLVTVQMANPPVRRTEHALRFAFRRKAVVTRLPLSVWIYFLMTGTIGFSVGNSDLPVTRLASELEQLRRAATVATDQLATAS